jgi:hypothetical protein
MDQGSNKSGARAERSKRERDSEGKERNVLRRWTDWSSGTLTSQRGIAIACIAKERGTEREEGR